MSDNPVPFLIDNQTAYQQMKDEHDAAIALKKEQHKRGLPFTVLGMLVMFILCGIALYRAGVLVYKYDTSIFWYGAGGYIAAQILFAIGSYRSFGYIRIGNGK